MGVGGGGGYVFLGWTLVSPPLPKTISCSRNHHITSHERVREVRLLGNRRPNKNPTKF